MDLLKLANIKGCPCGRKHEVDIKKIIIKRGALELLPDIIKEYNAGLPVLLICDDNTYVAAGQKVEMLLDQHGIPCIIVKLRAKGVLVPDEKAVATIEKEAEPTEEPTSIPEIEPEKIDLGHDAWLLIRELPDNIAYDVDIDSALKDDIPDSRNFDYVQSEIVKIDLIENGGPTIIDNGIVELCFSTTLIAGNEKPVPYYWDTNNTPLLDGRALRISTLKQESDLVTCMMIDKSGAFGLVAR